MDLRRKKLLYRSSRRGIKEMDVLLGQFAREHIEGMSDEDLSIWQKICELNDRDLLGYFVDGREIDLPDRNMGYWLLKARNYWHK